MMKKLDERGVAALEFAVVAVPLFTLMFVIFDLGRYAITAQSLRALADAEARAIMIGCYTKDVTSSPKVSPAGCTSDPMTSTAKRAVAPFLYAAGLTPTVRITASFNALTITATQAGFTMMMPIWGTTLNAPSASTSIPFYPLSEAAAAQPAARRGSSTTTISHAQMRTITMPSVSRGANPTRRVNRSFPAT